MEECQHGACLSEGQAEAKLHPDEGRPSQAEVCTAGAQTATESGGVKPTHALYIRSFFGSSGDLTQVTRLLSFLLYSQIYALNKVMTELEQQQFEAFCKQMQSQGE